MLYPIHFASGVAARQGDLPGHLGQGRRRAVLRLGRRVRGGALRQDGAQRHRVWRHADHLRGLHADEERARHVVRRDEQGLRGVEQGRARLVPHRDHHQHPRLQGHRRRAARRENHGPRWPEGHREVDRDLLARPRHASHADRRGCVRAVPLSAAAGTPDRSRAPRGPGADHVRWRQGRVRGGHSAGAVRLEDRVVRPGVHAAAGGR